MKKNHYLCVKIKTKYLMNEINRLKIVLVEQKRTGKWLADQLSKDPSTVSKWCSNTTQPSLDTLMKISSLLNVDIHKLINKSDTE